MGKGSKILGILLVVLAVVCFGMYFVYGSKFSEYKVTFDSDGGTIVQEQIVKKGEKATKPADPTKEKNDFVEWQLNGVAYNFDNVVSGNITLKALWKAYNTFKVNVKLDKDEYNMDIREGEPIKIETFNIPTKEGYRIKLYNDKGEEYDLTKAVTSDLDLIAKYVEIKTYTVKFDSSGGTKVSDVKVTDGDKVDEPTTTRDGYVFDGWYLGNDKYDFSTPVTKAITLKARWNEAGKVTVTFVADGKTYKTVSVKENTKVANPGKPTKKGYKFVEWQLDGEAFDFNTKITKETTITASFEEATTYTVTFNSDGGSAVKSQDVTTVASKPADPTKSGYVFVEWQLNGKKYDFSKEVVEDITLKAKWEKEKPKYTVTFDSNGGSAVPNQEVVEGEKVTKPSDPKKSGYAFEEWLFDNKTFDFTTEITKSITLTARYRLLNKYTVTFDSDGGSAVTGQTVNEGEKVGRPTDPTKEGATFAGWQLNGTAYDFSKAVTSDLTLKATWTPNTTNHDVVEDK